MFIEDIVPSSDQNRRDLMAGSWGKMPHTTMRELRTLLCYFVLRGNVLVLYSDRDPSYKTSEPFHRRHQILDRAFVKNHEEDLAGAKFLHGNDVVSNLIL